MLDNIQNTSSEIITHSQTLDKISGFGVSNPIENDRNYFIDQSDISATAFEKYQREEDIKTFSELLMQTSEEEANGLVLANVLQGNFSIENEDVLAKILSNEEFINDIFK